MKKIVASLLCALMIVSVLSANVGAFEYITDDTFALGDVNSDDSVNAIDANLMKSAVAGYDAKLVSDAADFNADGTVSAKDVFCLKACLAGAKTPADYGDDKPFVDIKIGGAPVSSFVITVADGIDPDGSTDSVQRAADVLQRTILSASGIYINTCKEEDIGDRNVIMFHVIPLGEEMNAHTADIENYYYKVSEGRLDIYGSPYRGNIYAVYEILEDFFGIRWYSTQNAFVYKTRLVDIPVGYEKYHESPFSYRFAIDKFYNISSRQGALDYYFPARLNGTQMGAYTSDYYGTLTGPHALNAHTFQDYWKMADGDEKVEDDGTLSRYELLRKKYNAGTEPDITKWQPCATGADSYEKLFRGMLLRIEMIFSDPKNNNIMRTDEGISCMSFSICDNSNYCQCRFCSAIRNGAEKFQLRNQLEVDNFKAAFLGDYELTPNGRTTYLKVGAESDSGLYVNLTNRAAIDIQEYYPGLRLYTIIYDPTVPASVKPNGLVNIMYCGQGCNNHYIGSGECGDNLTVLGSSNKTTADTFPKWAEMCHETGAQLWFWYYPVTCAYYLNDCPNVINIYYDFKFIYESGADGIYYEGESEEVNFNLESLKSYLATKMMWQPDMTYDEYVDYMKEFLYIYYGDGYEYLYRYILLDDECGKACGCFVNNHDRPFDMHSRVYLNEHYEEMRECLTNALALTKTEEQYDRLFLMFNCFEFMGLSATYDSHYVNGTAEERAVYTERYTAMIEYMNEINLPIFYSSETYSVPDEVDLSRNPMLQFYGIFGWTSWAQ